MPAMQTRFLYQGFNQISASNRVPGLMEKINLDALRAAIVNTEKS